MKIVISFTTTSERIHHIEPTLTSISKQTEKPTHFILWISSEPYLLDKGISQLTDSVTNSVPNFIKDYNVEVRWTENIGSYRKLIPTLKWLDGEEAVVITIDDDTIYPPKWLETFLEFTSRFPQFALGYIGRIFKEHSLDYAKTKLIGPPPYEYPVQHMLQVDTLVGAYGILYRSNFFDLDKLIQFDNYPSALKVDDIWFNGHLASSGIDRYCLHLPGGMKPEDSMRGKGITRLWDVNKNHKDNNDTVKLFEGSW